MKHQLEMEAKKIEREYGRLKKCFSQFKSLKQEISAEMNNGTTNSAVNEKAAQIQRLFPGGFSALEKSFNSELSALNVELKKLNTQMKHTLIGSENKGE